MKKLMFAVAAMAAGIAVADISSSNIVGYTNKDAEQGKFMILGAQFDDMAGGNDISIIGGLVGVPYDDGGDFLKTAPQVQIPNSMGGYDTYYYLQDAWDSDSQNVVQGWSDNFGDLVKASFTPGVAMWLKSVETPSNANVAGQVTDAEDITIECPASFALRANVFPEAFDINGKNVEYPEIAAVPYDDGSDFLKTAPQIQIPNAMGGYDTYYYLQDAWDSNLQMGVPGWSDNFGDLVSSTVPVAQGFWTKGMGGTMKIKFIK